MLYDKKMSSLKDKILGSSLGAKFGGVKEVKKEKVEQVTKEVKKEKYGKKEK